MSELKKETLTGIGLIITGLFCWSGTTILFRIWASKTEPISPFLFMFVRYILATLLVSIPWFIKYKKEAITHIRRIDSSVLISLLVLGSFGIAYHNLSLYLGLQYLNASLGAIILALAPVFSEFFSMKIYNRKISLKVIFWGLLSFIGVIIALEYGNTSIDLIGIFWIISSALALAYFNAYSSKLMHTHDIDSISVTFYTITIATIWLIPLTFYDFLNNLTFFNSVSQIDYWLAILYMSIIGIFIGRSLYNMGLQKTGSNITTIITNFGPLITMLLGFIFLDEKITIGLVLGSIIILFSVFQVLRIENHYPAGH